MVGESLPRDLAASSSFCQSFVCMHRLACWWWTVDTGNKLAGYLRLKIIMNFNYLCFLPTYHSPLQECYYYIQIPPLYMNEPTQSKKYHKLKQNLNGIKGDVLAPIRCFITLTGSRSRRYYGNQKLTSLHYCLATSRSTLLHKHMILGTFWIFYVLRASLLKILSGTFIPPRG